MFRFCIVFAVLAVAVAFQMKINKIVGAVASVGVCLAPLAPALADGAVSASTKYRARTSYGAKIVDLAPAAEKGDFAAFDNKKAVAAFDLFISGSNKKVQDRPLKKAEQDLEAKIFEAVKSKNSAALKSAYNEFIKVADLKSEYKPGELGQTDSSGYSPTWGTSRQYIYQR